MVTIMKKKKINIKDYLMMVVMNIEVAEIKEAIREFHHKIMTTMNQDKTMQINNPSNSHKETSMMNSIKEVNYYSSSNKTIITITITITTIMQV